MSGTSLRGHVLDARADTETSDPGWATLPSGRTLDLGRSRWDGVLDREEYEYCRQHDIPLGYDCTQIGWVIESCADESSAAPMSHALPGPAVDTADPERRAIGLRGVVEASVARILADVRAGRMSLDAAQLRLELDVAQSMKGFASEHGLPISDLCHWALESVVSRSLGAVRGPRLQSPPASDAAAFAFRPWVPDDAGVYFELLGNPRIWEYLPEPFPSPFTPETARTLIEVASISFHHETAAVEVDGRPIGQCLLRFDQPFAGARASEVAYWLGEEHWGKGLMSRILPVFTHRSFRRHGVDVIYAWIMKDNVASTRVAECAGYQRAPVPFESRLAESLGRPGFIRYATYRSDWPVEADDASDLA